MKKTPRLAVELDEAMKKYLDDRIPELLPGRIIKSVRWTNERKIARTIYEALGQPSTPEGIMAFGYLVAVAKLHYNAATGLEIVARHAPIWAHRPPTIIGGMYHGLAEHFERIRDSPQKQSSCLEAALDATDVAIPHSSGQGFNGRRPRGKSAGTTYRAHAAG